MREEHAEHEHRAVLKGLPRFSRPRDLSQRDRQRSQSHRAEARRQPAKRDRKSTRLNSSHSQISYAVFCLKKKKNTQSMKTFCPSHSVSIPITSAARILLSSHTLRFHIHSTVRSTRTALNGVSTLRHRCC